MKSQLQRENIVRIYLLRKYEYLSPIMNREYFSYSYLLDAIEYVKILDTEINIIMTSDRIDPRIFLAHDFDYMLEYDFDETFYIDDDTEVTIDEETLKALLNTDIIELI